MNCIIIEPDKTVADNLKNYIQQISGCNWVGAFLSDADGMAYTESNAVNFIVWSFPLCSLSEKFFTNKTKDHPEVIFLTNDPADAIKAYELGAADCILKPVQFARFLLSVNRVKNIIENKKKESLKSAYSPHLRCIFIKTEYKLMKINFDDILYMEGLKDYTKIYLKDSAKPIITLQNLKAFENKLSPDEFIRVHRSYIISISKINLIYKNRIILGKADIPISDGFKNHINEIVERYS
ncbi:MAG: LytTR family DNA-binding domain-containing protein [Chitinophagaceae bacterium]|jgi:DNA-binding LytR/AlgR family response regulator|nr:LytTR family DNA-binding domain-containing protein [Chitinophagaceae bacterium]